MEESTTMMIDNGVDDNRNYVEDNPSEIDQPETKNEDDNSSDDEMLLIPQYLPNERVFCKDASSDVLYESLVKKMRPADDGKSVDYLIHYIGWNARWDRWLPSEDIMPHSPENAQRYQEQQRQQRRQQQEDRENNNWNNTGAANATAASRTSTIQGSSSRKRRKLSGAGRSSVKDNNQTNKLLEEVCDLPFTLKTVLIDEWERITRRGFQCPYGYDYYTVTGTNNNNVSDTKKKTPTPRAVHHLPASVTVRKILNHFEKTQKQKILQLQQQPTSNPSSSPTPIPSAGTTISNIASTTTSATIASGAEHNSSKTNHNKNNANKEKIVLPLPPQIIATTITPTQLRHFCQRLETLFEQALPACLLYPQERPQYQHFIQSSHQQKRLAEVYGCEYLLRLFVRLPTLLKNSQTLVATSTTMNSVIIPSTATSTSNDNNHNDSNNIDRNNVNWDMEEHPDHYIYIAHLLNELMLLLQKNRQACFKGNYRQPRTEELLPTEK